MTMPRPIAQALFLLLLTAAVVHGSPTAPAGRCAAAAELRERLEGVTESVIDGQPARLAPAAERAWRWWSAHRDSFQPTDNTVAQMDSLMRVHHSHPRTAARAAVAISIESLNWCSGPPDDEDRLMLLDLAGQAGWLRARGQLIEWPDGVQAATDSLAAHLRARGHPARANELQRSIAALLARTRGTAADVSIARQVLELVDVLEQLLL